MKNPTYGYFVDTSQLKTAINLVREQKMTHSTELSSMLACLMLGVFLDKNGF
ncbi:hypothetical protein [Emticicia fontis]